MNKGENANERNLRNIVTAILIRHIYGDGMKTRNVSSNCCNVYCVYVLYDSTCII